MPMKRKIIQGPPEPDPLDELRSEVSALRSEVTELHNAVNEGFQEIKTSLGDILRELESKDES
jgi:hypothetical protein